MRFKVLWAFLLIWIACDDNPTAIVQHRPVIHSITLERTVVYTEDTIEISAEVSDQDADDELKFLWQATGGSFISEINNPTQWQAPKTPGTYQITLTLTDGHFTVSKSAEIRVVSR